MPIVFHPLQLRIILSNKYGDSISARFKLMVELDDWIQVYRFWFQLKVGKPIAEMVQTSAIQCVDIYSEIYFAIRR